METISIGDHVGLKTTWRESGLPLSGVCGVVVATGATGLCEVRWRSGFIGCYYRGSLAKLAEEDVVMCLLGHDQ